MTLEELKKIKESLTDLGDIVWNDMDEHSPTTVRNLDESIEIINKEIENA
jgi:t-SNARE complex subunit (syntaxin)|tara:strand:+ start:389 stop:538 length:150 start_codon:yes stop_codon:yes gene_type:complete